MSRGPDFASDLATGFASVKVAFFLKTENFDGHGHSSTSQRRIARRVRSFAMASTGKECFALICRVRIPDSPRELLVNSVPSTIWQMLDSFIDSTVHSKKNIRAAASIFKNPTSWGTSHGLGDSSLLILPDALLWYLCSNANTTTAPSDATAACSGDLWKHGPLVSSDGDLVTLWWLYGVQCAVYLISNSCTNGPHNLDLAKRNRNLVWPIHQCSIFC